MSLINSCKNTTTDNLKTEWNNYMNNINYLLKQDEFIFNSFKLFLRKHIILAHGSIKLIFDGFNLSSNSIDLLSHYGFNPKDLPKFEVSLNNLKDKKIEESSSSQLNKHESTSSIDSSLTSSISSNSTISSLEELKILNNDLDFNINFDFQKSIIDIKFVKENTNKIIFMDLTIPKKILHLKYHIYQEFNIDLSIQTIIYKGKICDDYDLITNEMLDDKFYLLIKKY